MTMMHQQATDDSIKRLVPQETCSKMDYNNNHLQEIGIIKCMENIT